MDDFKKVIDGLLCDVYPQYEYIDGKREYYTVDTIDGETAYLCDALQAGTNECVAIGYFTADQCRVPTGAV